MATQTRSFHQVKSDLAIGAMTVVLYGMLAAVFFACLSIPNIYLRHLNRTFATTLLTFCVLIIAMHAVYGGFDVGRKKSKPVISALVTGTVITDLVAYLQMEIMNVNENYNDHLILFGADLLYLLLALVLQVGIIICFVRVGNDLYFRFHPPRSVLLIVGDEDQEIPLRSKISRYRLQWSVDDCAMYNAPDLRERIANAEVVFLGQIPQTDKAIVLKMCYDLRKDIMCKAQLQETILCNSRPAIVDDAPFLEMEFFKMSFYQRAVKRGGDILISLLCLIILSPLMGVIAAAIHLEDHGPVFFRQKRLTIRGWEFTIWKFRTMKVEASLHDNQVSTAINDPRITRVGKVLRRFRMDEIPQFINVLKGEMSLVGPRPEMLANIDRYKETYPDFAYREKMKAGITGYAQIEGRYNTTPEDKLMLDLMYIESFSVWLDIKLLMRTATVLFKRDSTQGFELPPLQSAPKEIQTPKRRRRSQV
ncbi:MAG: exopolysaccharide biosynthesis polyprenyl glycosylphosphotransferase [Clostridia bacterium]|nr:exopolysaccharide biosynthesis polyprenyl glycosylphosphotransferase [Clostridia bacterium]